MKTLLKAVLGLVLLGGAAAMAHPGLKAPSLEVPAFKVVKIHAPDVDEKAALVWRVTPSDQVSKADSARGTLQFTAPPGDYKVELLVLTPDKDGKLQTDEYDVMVRILPVEGKPEPVPPPKVVPPVKPPEKGSGTLDAPKALGKISFPPYGCTATVIGPRRADGRWDVLSAAHCVSHVKVGSKGSMLMLDGRKFAITVVMLDEKCDCSWLVTDDVIEEMPYANLAADNPPVGTKIWHAGYGVDKPGNREDGSVTGGENNEGQIEMSISVSSGDSGGGMFRTDTNELISCVCCTTAKGRTARVWGCSVNQARSKRPAKVQTFEWNPKEIPEVSFIRP